MIIRLYEPISLVFPEGASMPQGATADLPCFLCQSRTHLPPAKMGWMSAGSGERIFLVCSDCGWDRTDEELEARIVERISDKAPVAAE